MRTFPLFAVLVLSTAACSNALSNEEQDVSTEQAQPLEMRVETPSLYREMPSACAEEIVAQDVCFSRCSYASNPDGCIALAADDECKGDEEHHQCYLGVDVQVGAAHERGQAHGVPPGCAAAGDGCAGVVGAAVVRPHPTRTTARPSAGKNRCMPPPL